ncbi:MAG: hypothetical protein CMI69_02440 [Candidatus Pelagibacter sp.]|nr:hypothetical protein [Candidatus Pelagibacter sp.]
MIHQAKGRVRRHNNDYGFVCFVDGRYADNSDGSNNYNLTFTDSHSDDSGLD